MEDIKAMMDVGRPEWGIEGYTIAKTPLIIQKSAIISPDKRNGPSREEKLKANSPDPTKYAETYEKTHQKYWHKACGKFYKSKKTTYLEQQALRSKSNPGPGTYLNKDSDKEKFTKHSPLGRFDKSERLSFLTTVESYAEEVPSCWKYETGEAKKVQSMRWIKPKAEKKIQKSEVGPGKYWEGVDKALVKTMNNSPKYSFPKDKAPHSMNSKSFANKTPGVGSYKESDKAFFKHLTKRIRTAVILPYKLKSFTDIVAKISAQTPGPGAYNIIPVLKK